MRNVIFVLAALAVVGACGGQVSAAILSTDVNAMPGWAGSTPMVGPYVYFAADLEYAVYAPGDFALSFPGEAVAPDQYVYAYQVINVTGNWQSQGIYPQVVGVSVGMDDGVDGVDEDEKPTVPSFVADASLVAPSNVFLNIKPDGMPSSARWDFYAPAVTEGAESCVIYFTSPYEPEMDYVTVNGVGAAMGTAPSPTPEPTSLMLLAAGAMALVRNRRRA